MRGLPWLRGVARSSLQCWQMVRGAVVMGCLVTTLTHHHLQVRLPESFYFRMPGQKDGPPGTSFSNLFARRTAMNCEKVCVKRQPPLSRCQFRPLFGHLALLGAVCVR